MKFIIINTRNAFVSFGGISGALTVADDNIPTEVNHQLNKAIKETEADLNDTVIVIVQEDLNVAIPGLAKDIKILFATALAHAEAPPDKDYLPVLIERIVKTLSE